MLYKFLKYYVQLCFGIYHRKVYMIDTQNLPKEGPVILALNHPGGFLDACVISAYSSRPLYYLTAGNYFVNKVARYFLNATHQIPVFRGQDGIGNLRKNQETFSICHQKLSEGRVVLVFVEGSTAMEKHLRPVQKGTARIVFGTNEEYPGVLPVVVPVGVTFSEASGFGRDAILRYGKPIPADQYLDLQKQEPQKAYTELTARIEDGLGQAMIILDDPEREALFDDAVILLETPPRGIASVSDSPAVFDWQTAIAHRINAFSDAELETLAAHLDGIKQVTQKSGLPFYLYPLLEDRRVHPLFMILTAVFNFSGKLIELIPTWLTRRFVLSKVQRPVFIGPLKSLAGLIIHILYYLILTIALGLIFGNEGWLAGVGIAVLGYFSLTQHRRPHLLHGLRWWRIPRDEKEKLRALRKQIGEMLQ